MSSIFPQEERGLSLTLRLNKAELTLCEFLPNAKYDGGFETVVNKVFLNYIS